MKQTQQILMGVFICIIGMLISIVVLFETDTIVSGGLADDAQTEFLFTVVMELATLGCAFLALRLFKFEKIRADLLSLRETALRKWGVTRLLLLGGPLLFNTLLYYLYMKPTFGYLAIMLLLCMPFVFPTMSRCIAETTDEEKEV